MFSLPLTVIEQVMPTIWLQSFFGCTIFAPESPLVLLLNSMELMYD